jgi:polysaccharide export outer membrane protein
VSGLSYAGLCLSVCLAWQITAATELKQRPTQTDVAYLLGPEDELSIQVADLDQFSGKTFRVDPSGILHLPVVGDMKAAGISVEDLQTAVTERLRKLLKHPEVAINVVAFHSQPVSVWGAVNQPGLHQLQGPSRLIEMISSAGGTRADAGSRIRITREIEWGVLPVNGARVDSSGHFSTADINLNELTKGLRPEENIYLRAHDVINVDKADLVYVIGEVKKAGGFTLAARENISVLQALSLAEGLTPAASPKSAKILRKNPESAQRDEIPVNVKMILDGKAPDVVLRSDDIVFIPNNIPRSVAIRSAEAAIQIGTGLVIWRR